MILRNPPISNVQTGLNHPSFGPLLNDNRPETQMSYSAQSSQSRWKSSSKSKSVNSGLGAVVPIGAAGMVLRREKRSSMLNEWVSEIRVLGEKGLLGVDCNVMRWVWGLVTILMSHGYCMLFCFAKISTAPHVMSQLPNSLITYSITEHSLEGPPQYSRAGKGIH